MYESQIITPKLTEPGVKYYVSSVLKNSNLMKYQINNFSINLLLFLLFTGFICLLLYVLYKDKHKSVRDLHNQNEQLQKIVDKTKQYTDEQQKKSNGLITDLPQYKNEFENIIMRLM